MKIYSLQYSDENKPLYFKTREKVIEEVTMSLENLFDDIEEDYEREIDALKYFLDTTECEKYFFSDYGEYEVKIIDTDILE